MCNQCYSQEEREQREYIDKLRDRIESLPAEVYNANIEHWQSKLTEAEIKLDAIIDERLAQKREPEKITQFEADKTV